MMARLAAWWRARAQRERLLIQAAGALLFAVLAPLWAYQGASHYRETAAAELASARAVRDNVAKLETGTAQASPDLPGADGTLRGLVMAAAQSGGLTVTSVEPAGPDRVRIAFSPADSTQIYRWMDAVGRRGAFVRRTALIRTGESDQVSGEFEIAASP